MAITLYELEGCPYCIKVADELREYDIPYETTWVDSLHSDRSKVKRVSGQRKVPVLVDDRRGVVMAESENIIQYIEKTLVPSA